MSDRRPYANPREAGKRFSEDDEEINPTSSSSSKRMKGTPVDRLSALPDSLLVRIISCLRMKEAALTCLLSKRWRFVWTAMPKLEFVSSYKETAKEFVARVHKTLVFFRGNHLERFAVNFGYDSSFSSDVYIWVGFALRNKVKDVALKFYLNSKQDLCILPQIMFCNPSLTRLSLQECAIVPRMSIDWKSLTNLELYKVELNQYAIENVLSGCPVLNILSLILCGGFKSLKIHSKNLYSLTINHYHNKEKHVLEISAPYLHNLKYEGRIMQLTNISSLVSADIDFYEPYAKVMSYTKELIEKLQHVKKLKVGVGFFEVLIQLVENCYRLPQYGGEYLILNAPAYKQSITTILSMLESSPNLDKLVVKWSFDYDEDPSLFLLESYKEKDDLNCDLLHLKTVEIISLGELQLDGALMLTLVQILLKRARVLRKMVIGFEDVFVNPNVYVEVAKTLLSYPRSSQEAVVLLC